MDTPYPGVPSATIPIIVIAPRANVFPIGSRVYIQAIDKHGTVEAWSGTPLWYRVQLDAGHFVLAPGDALRRAAPFVGWRPVVVSR